MEVQQNAVENTVAVTGEHVGPGEVQVTGQSGRIKRQREDGADGGREFADHPGTDKGNQIADRAGDHGEQQGVFEHLGEHVVIQEHPNVVLQEDELGRLQHIEIGETESDGGHHRDNGQNEKGNHIRRHHTVGSQIHGRLRR